MTVPLCLKKSAFAHVYVLACVCVSLVLAHKHNQTDTRLAHAQTPECPELLPEGELCSSITDMSQCGERAAKATDGVFGRCGVMGSSCLTTGPQCRPPPTPCIGLPGTQQETFDGKQFVKVVRIHGRGDLKYQHREAGANADKLSNEQIEAIWASQNGYLRFYCAGVSTTTWYINRAEEPGNTFGNDLLTQCHQGTPTGTVNPNGVSNAYATIDCYNAGFGAIWSFGNHYGGCSGNSDGALYVECTS